MQNKNNVIVTPTRYIPTTKKSAAHIAMPTGLTGSTITLTPHTHAISHSKYGLSTITFTRYLMEGKLHTHKHALTYFHLIRDVLLDTYGSSHSNQLSLTLTFASGIQNRNQHFNNLNAALQSHHHNDSPALLKQYLNTH